MSASQQQKLRKPGSPWRRQAMCDTAKARASYARYLQRGKQKERKP